MKTAFHIDALYLRHRNPDGHPERVGAMEALLGMAKRGDEFGVSVLPATRRATLDELTRVHTPEYVDTIASTAGRFSMLDPDTFTCPDSYDVALSSRRAAVLDVVDRVMSGRVRQRLRRRATARPSCRERRAMGFCLFNNIAVAAAHALAHHGSSAS